MPTDPLSAARYPASSAAPNVPQDIQNAVFDLSSQGIPRFATTAARDTAYPSPVAGQHAWVVDRLYVYTGSAWERSLSVPSAWSTADITLATGWTQADSGSTRDLAIRLEGDMAVLTGTRLDRSATLATSPGVGTDILTVGPR